MSELGFSLPLRDIGTIPEIVELAQGAEAAGYHSIWMPEAWGRDAFTMLAILAGRTSTIQLATGIVNVFSRSPALIAQAAATLDDGSGGRVILGLGASGRRVIEGWHGVPFDRPLQRTREYVEIIRLAVAGERVDYRGQTVTLNGFSLAFRPPRRQIPIYLAAIGPANIRLAGEVADGWLPIFTTPPGLSALLPALDEGELSAGRARGSVRVAAYVPALLGDRAEALHRTYIAYYVGAMGVYYHALLRRSGWAREADEIRLRWLRGDRHGAAGCIPHAMVAALTISGSAREARARLAAFRAAGVDLPILSMPAGASPSSIRATLEALAGA